MLDMLRGPGTAGGVTTGSKLVIRGIPPTAMGAYPGQDRYEIMASICSKPASKWTPIWLREGSQCPHSRSRRRVFRRTHPQYLAPPGDARQSGADASRHALHGDGRAPGVPFRPRQPDAGEGVALRVFGRKAGCGSYPKGRRSIVPNVHGPRLARRLPAEQGASKTHAVYPGVCGIERALQLFRCAGRPLSIRNGPTYRWVASRVVRPQGRLSGSYPKGRGSIVPDAWGAPAGRSGQGLKVRRTC